MLQPPTSRATLDRRFHRRALATLLLGLCLLGADAQAEPRDGEGFSVIVNVDNAMKEASRDFVAEAFLKKTTRWRDGEAIRPVDLPPDSATRRQFSDSVLKRSVAAVRSYWQQRIFTGRDVPPPELDGDEAVVRYVAKHPGAIGYVGWNAKLAGVRVLTVRAK